MTHPDDSTLQQWLDQALDASLARELSTHVQACDRCARRAESVRALGRALRHWAQETQGPNDALLGAILAATTQKQPDAPAGPPAPTQVPPARPSGPRRFLYPALAAVAAAIFALRTPPQEPPTQAHPPVHTPPHIPPQNPPSEPSEGPGGAEVTRVDVQGAKSYAVLVIPGMRASSTSAVVWIQDEPEDPGAADPPTPVTVQ